MKEKRWFKALPLLLAVALLGLFVWIFFADNKYQTSPPYGRDGVLELTQEDVRRQTPVFLIDGWLLTDRTLSDYPTYIGQFGSLQRGQWSQSAHGSAAYELTLRYSGEPVETSISFPQLFSRHRILLDGRLLSEGVGGARVAVRLSQGDHLLRVETVSANGYYSGMYHPAALGTSETVSRMVLTQCIAYGVAFFVPLALAIFTLALWCGAKDKAAFWFGLLCCCFSGYVSYYFVRLLSLPVGEYWHLVQSAALYGLCFCVLRLAALTGQVVRTGPALWVQRTAGLLAVALLALAVMIPARPWAVWLHGFLTDLFYGFTCCGVLLLVWQGRKTAGWESRLTRMGCVSFGVGLLYNLFGSKLLAPIFQSFNLFEPIRFFWQFEWCALLLVLLFGAVMVARNRRILAENAAFQNGLEDMVQQRTVELRNLLQERKAFFADMAHDLKAPIFAAGSFIRAIREHDTGVDSELLRYIDLVEQKQSEMLGRVQGLAEFNRMDELSEPHEVISIQTLLAELDQIYQAAARAQAVYFAVQAPAEDAALYAQPKKLDILFENLIFNALRATPEQGRIVVEATLDGDTCHLTIRDTGCGIAREELPRVFERFFVGRENAGSGSGLGLYIVKCIVTELKGRISVASELGRGTVFSIDLPLYRKP